MGQIHNAAARPRLQSGQKSQQGERYPYFHGDPIPQPDVIEDDSAAAWEEWHRAAYAQETVQDRSHTASQRNARVTPATNGDPFVAALIASRRSVRRNNPATAVTAAHPTRKTPPNVVHFQRRKESFRLLRFFLRLIGFRA